MKSIMHWEQVQLTADNMNQAPALVIKRPDGSWSDFKKISIHEDIAVLQFVILVLI